MMRRIKLKSRTGKIIAAGVILFIFSLAGWLGPLNQFVGRILGPVVTPLSSATRAVDNWLNPGHNEQLEAELLELRSQQGRQQLEFENEQLRRQLNFASRRDFKFVGAEVNGYQPDSLRVGVSINRGAHDGLRPGMAVVNEGFLVGRVHEVFDRRASVVLLTDPTFRLQALTREHRTRGVVRGEVGATVVLGSIIQNEAINTGDTVVSSGAAGEFPPGLVIGHVADVAPVGGTVFQTAALAPGSSLANLSFVLVITGGY